MMSSRSLIKTSVAFALWSLVVVRSHYEVLAMVDCGGKVLLLSAAYRLINGKRGRGRGKEKITGNKSD